MRDSIASGAKTLKQRILEVISQQPGLTDREITEIVKGRGEQQQAVNQACRQLEMGHVLVRRRRNDGLIGNYRNAQAGIPTHGSPLEGDPPLGQRNASDAMSEDQLKKALLEWLERDGWKVRVAWAKTRGIDLEATKENKRWVIEAKGSGSRPEMRVNYFLAVIGELLQRMTDSTTRYSIALPDLAQFRGLWNRLPPVAKERTEMTALFVSVDGNVTERN